MKGPLTEQTFSCVRGADCHNLQPLNGTGLLRSQVAVRSAGCWSTKGQQISPGNRKGIANVTEAIGSNGTTLYYVFTFGISSVRQSIDYGLTLAADDAGHDLCWCGLDSCSDEDFSVPLGKLRVEGPLSNQETSCAVGQPCSLSAVQAVGISPDDRLALEGLARDSLSIPALNVCIILSTVNIFITELTVEFCPCDLSTPCDSSMFQLLLRSILALCP